MFFAFGGTGGSRSATVQTTVTLKAVGEMVRGFAAFLAGETGAEWLDGRKPWSTECDVAMPCATQNELTGEDAATLIKTGDRITVDGYLGIVTLG